MWGSIYLEASTQQNFNFGFSTHKSDILLHLAQWQYWWWFWFSLLWVLYFYLILTSITRRFNTFNPNLNTSLRGHGKWGDFLVALIPLSWCGNILVNSNFILRMIEWQNESSLFTLRIQGKQWYWVYKFDISAVHTIAAAPKNIGHNKWYFNVGNETYIADSYVQAMNTAAQLEFQEEYNSYLQKNNTDKFTFSKNQVNTTVINKTSLKTNNKNINYTSDFLFNKTNKTRPFFNLLDKLSLCDPIWKRYYCFLPGKTQLEFNLKKNFIENLVENTEVLKNSKLLPFFNKINNLSNNYLLYSKTLLTSYYLPKLEVTSDDSANIHSIIPTKPLQFFKGILNQHNINSLKTNTKNLILFKLKNTSDKTFSTKNYHVENYWGFRQKKYKRPTKFNYITCTKYDPKTLQPVQTTQPTKTSLFNYTIIPLETNSNNLSKKIINNVVYVQNKNWQTQNTNLVVESKAKLENAQAYFNGIKNNKVREDLLSVTLSRRLLRTKRTLVLPAHVNITVITNSYDVVHSWFIPGLGIKLDCVPGRSTHHTFYVDNVGFYYGQCAEICGRYHHHMPIRVCALPFEHFLVWWQTKGFPRLARLNSKIK